MCRSDRGRRISLSKSTICLSINRDGAIPVTVFLFSFMMRMTNGTLVFMPSNVRPDHRR